MASLKYLFLIIYLLNNYFIQLPYYISTIDDMKKYGKQMSIMFFVLFLLVKIQLYVRIMRMG